MMKFRVFGPGLLILLVTCLYSISVQSQADHPAVITPQNISDLSEVRRIGGTLPGELAWSPDGKKLAVGTSTGAAIYTTVNLDQPPVMLDAGMDVKFSNDDMLISDGKIWNLAKNSHYSLPPEQTSAIPPSPSGRYEVRSATKDQMLTFYIKDNTRPFDAELKLDIGLNTNYAGIAFSRDEHLLALVLNPSISFPKTYGGEVQIWDLTTGQRISTLAYNDAYENDTWWPLEMIRFSYDNRELIMLNGYHHYVGDGGSASLEVLSQWDVDSGKLINHWAGSWDPYVVSPDQRWIAYNTEEDGLLLWNGYTVLELKVPVHDLADGPGMAFSNNSRALATVGLETTVWDLDPVSGKVQVRSFLEIGQNFISLHTNYDGSKVLARMSSNSNDEPSILWRIDDSNSDHIIKLAQSQFYEARFSPNNNYVLLHDLGSPVTTLWSTTDGQLAYTFPAEVEISSGWTYAAYWNEEIVHIVELATGKDSVLKVINDFAGKVVALNLDANMVVLAGNDLDFYPLSSLEPDQSSTLRLPLTDKVGKIMFSANGKRVAIVEDPRSYGNSENRPIVWIWELNPQAKLVNKISDSLEPIRYLFQLSPDGESLVVYEDYIYMGNPGASLVDVSTGQVRTFWDFQGGGLYSLEFTLDGTILIGADRDGKLYGWQIVEMSERATGEKFRYSEGIIKFYDPDFRGILSSELDLSPRGNYLIADCGQDTVCVYNIHNLPTTGALILDSYSTLNNFRVEYATSILFNPTETLLLIKDAYEDTFYLRKVERNSDRSLVQYPEFPGTGIAAFSPDGQLLAAENADNIALYSVYNLIAGNTTPLRVLEKPRLPLREVIFSKDGRSLYVRDDSGVSIWGISR